MSCREAKVGDDKGQGHTLNATKIENTKLYRLAYILTFSRMLEFRTQKNLSNICTI